MFLPFARRQRLVWSMVLILIIAAAIAMMNKVNSHEPAKALVQSRIAASPLSVVPAMQKPYDRKGFTNTDAVVQRYLSSMADDYADLKQAVTSHDVAATVKSARHLLCSVDGFDDWSLGNNKKDIAIYTALLKTRLAKVINTTGSQVQYKSFLEVTASLENLRNSLRREKNLER